MERDCPSIFVLNDGGVHVGFLRAGCGRGHVVCVPPNINDGGVAFPKSHIKQIVLFNGLVYPKGEGKRHKILSIFELDALVNKAGYEFI